MVKTAPLYDDVALDEARCDGLTDSARHFALDEKSGKPGKGVCPHCADTRHHSYSRDRGWVCPAAPVALERPAKTGGKAA